MRARSVEKTITSVLPTKLGVLAIILKMRKRLRGVWNAEALAEQLEGEHTSRSAKYHHWMALPLRPWSVHGAPFSVPRCNQGGLQDEKHAMFLCAFYYSQARSEVGIVEQTEQLNYLAEEADQLNDSAEGHPSIVIIVTPPGQAPWVPIES
eukprot:1160703-Pelagomonas_calceolata.AAC.6